jgi:hypothetical protein
MELPGIIVDIEVRNYMSVKRSRWTSQASQDYEDSPLQMFDRMQASARLPLRSQTLGALIRVNRP